RAVRERTCLDKQKWQRKTPTLALVGAGGLLAHGSGLWAEENKSTSVSSMTEPVLGSLKKLEDLCRSLRPRGSFYDPVADVCNWLFFVTPPAGVSITPQNKANIEKLITDINSRLLSADYNQLKQIQSIYLVAGTRD